MACIYRNTQKMLDKTSFFDLEPYGLTALFISVIFFDMFIQQFVSISNKDAFFTLIAVKYFFMESLNVAFFRQYAF